MRTQRKSKNHYTPRLYLRGFTDPQGLLHVISRGDRDPWSSTPRSSTPDDVGFERDLYRPAAEDQDPNVFEDAFQTFETKAGPVIREIIEHRQMPVGDEALMQLYAFIALQAVRTPVMRRVFSRPLEHEARIVVDLVVSSPEMYERYMRRCGFDPQKVSYERMRAEIASGVEARATTEGFLQMAEAMASGALPYLHQRSWSILFSDRPDDQFVVSDQPVALVWSDGQETRYGPGHAHQGTDLTFPLSSSIALLGRYEPSERLHEATRDDVALINARTIRHARRFVAARSDALLPVLGVGGSS